MNEGNGIEAVNWKGPSPPPLDPFEDEEREEVDLGVYVRADQINPDEVERNWVVGGLFEQGRLYELFGKWKSAKTAVAIDLGCRLVQGQCWGGCRTVKSLVLYVAGEAPDDIKARVAAWKLKHPDSNLGPFYVRTLPVYLTDVEMAERLREEIETLSAQHPELPVVVFIDTLARNLGAVPEKGGDGLGLFANNLIDHVVRPTNAAVIVLHHSGHAETDRSRGSSEWHGAIDGSVKVTKDGAFVTVAPSFLRSSAGTVEICFQVVGQVLPKLDNFGDEIVCPVLEQVDAPPKSPRVLGKAQQKLWDKLVELSEDGKLMVTRAQLKDAFPDMRSFNFTRDLGAMLKAKGMDPDASVMSV